jgi:uncharacterized membrane protein
LEEEENTTKKEIELVEVSGRIGDLLSEATLREIEDVSPKLASKVQDELNQSVGVVACEVVSASVGPIPSPKRLKDYDLVLPGLAKRIVDMAEKEQTHRHETEAVVIRKDYSERKTGQVLGFIIGIAALGVALWLGLDGETAVASIIGGTTVLGLVSAFIISRTMEAKGEKPASVVDEEDMEVAGSEEGKG